MQRPGQSRLDLLEREGEGRLRPARQLQPLEQERHGCGEFDHRVARGNLSQRRAGLHLSLPKSIAEGQDGAAVAHLAQKDGRLAAHVTVLVLQCVAQGQDSSRPHLLQGCCRLPAGAPIGVPQQLDQGRRGPGIFDFTQCLDGHASHMPVVIPERFAEGQDRTPVAKLPEQPGGAPAHPRVVIPQRLAQRINGTGIAQLLEGPYCLPARFPARTPHRFDQGHDGPSIADTAQRLRRRQAHPPVLVC